MTKSQKDSINDMKSDLDSLSNKQFLNMKKKRSSDILDQNPPGNDEIKCSICLGEEKLIPKCYKCITCSSYFHLDCYNIFIIKETKEEKITEENALNNFECFRCKEEKKTGTGIKCFVCKNHSGIIKKKEEEKFLHHYCEVFFKDSLNNLRGGICKACSHKKIPVLKCQDQKCKEKYHIQCAILNKIIFCLPYMRNGELKIDENNFNEKIDFYCEIHNDELIKNFKDYSTTLLISKNDKVPKEEEKKENDTNKEKEKENNNDNNDEKNNDEKKDNDDGNKEQKMEEEEDDINQNNNNESNSKKEENNEEKKEENKEEKKEEKKVEEPKEKTIKSSVINLNSVNGSNSKSNSKKDIINVNKETKDNKEIKENKEEKEEEKEKNNSNNNNINNSNSKSENNNDSVDSSLKTPVKIDLSKHSSKIMKSNNSNSDIINVSIKKEKSTNILEEEEIDIDINVDKLNINNNEEMEEDDEDVEYNPPEIKQEKIDLFDNFKNKNENYTFPGAFYKFHF